MWKQILGLCHKAPYKGLWVWLLLASWLSVADLYGTSIIVWPAWMEIVMLLSLSFLKATVLYSLFLTAYPKKWSRIVMVIFLFVYSILCILNGMCYYLYGFGISFRMITVISQTNSREIMEFLPGFFSNLISLSTNIHLYALLAAIIAGWLILKRLNAKIFWALCLLPSLTGIIMTGIAVYEIQQGRNLFFVTIRTPKMIYASIREREAEKEILAAIRPLPDAESIFSNHIASTIVMVVGESASKGHWGLYGYPLPTTPYLSAISDSLFVFKDAIGNSTGTALNMECILTLKDDNSKDEWYNYPTLPDIFNHAGYRTWWLSNQERSGIWNNSYSAIVSRANIVKFLGKENSEEASAYRYDEVLLPEFYKAMSDTSAYKMINLHLMGSHTKYKMRYPSEYSRFTPQNERMVHKGSWLNDSKLNTIAAYDNSILYTDYILSQIIRMIERETKPSICIYFSDHGENVYSDRDFIGRDRKYVRIPLIIYANEAYRRLNPDVVNAIKNSLTKRFSTSGIPHLLMHLSKTSYSGYNPKRDILSHEYMESIRYIDGEPWDSASK